MFDNWWYHSWLRIRGSIYPKLLRENYSFNLNKPNGSSHEYLPWKMYKETKSKLEESIWYPIPSTKLQVPSTKCFMLWAINWKRNMPSKCEEFKRNDWCSSTESSWVEWMNEWTIIAMFSSSYMQHFFFICFYLFSVQWSSRADFSNIVGERVVNEWDSFQSTMAANCRITDLIHGRRYFFRSCCGNVKGWGQYRTSIPNSVTPSSK